VVPEGGVQHPLEVQEGVEDHHTLLEQDQAVEDHHTYQEKDLGEEGHHMQQEEGQEVEDHHTHPEKDQDVVEALFHAFLPLDHQGEEEVHPSSQLVDHHRQELREL